MNIDETKICNLALGQAGAKNFITDINIAEDTDEWRLASTFYPLARDYCREFADWNFLKSRAQLATTTDPTIGNYDHAYLLPADCLRPIDQIDENDDDTKYAYRWEGNTLLTNEDTCFIRYIKDITDVSKYPAIFVQCIILKLASLLSNPLKGEDAPKIDWEQLLEITLTKAQGLYCAEYEENGNDDVVNATQEI